jgi:hypothetical protein
MKTDNIVEMERMAYISGNADLAEKLAALIDIEEQADSLTGTAELLKEELETCKEYADRSIKQSDDMEFAFKTLKTALSAYKSKRDVKALVATLSMLEAAIEENYSDGSNLLKEEFEYIKAHSN